MLNTVVLLGVWSLGPREAEGVRTNSLQLRIPGREPLVSIPGRQHFTQCCHNALLEELNASCVTLPGGAMEACACSPPCFALCIFLFVALAVHPFTVIKPSCEYRYVLSPTGSPSRSPTPGMSLGTPYHNQKIPWLIMFPNIPRPPGSWSLQWGP